MRKLTCFQLSPTYSRPLWPHPGPRKGLVLSSPSLEAAARTLSCRVTGMLVAPMPRVLSLSRKPLFLLSPSEFLFPPSSLFACAKSMHLHMAEESPKLWCLLAKLFSRASHLFFTEVPPYKLAPCPAWLFPVLIQNPGGKKGS